MNSLSEANKSQGLTLIEVLIAVFILSLVAVISFQSLDASVRSKEAVEDNLAKLARVDRVWLLLEADLKNALSHTRRQTLGPGSGSDIPAMVVEDNSEDYWLTLLRGGHANPLNFVRTEVIRVGYRVEDDVLWRDVWYNLASVDSELAQQRKVVDGIENIQVRLLSPDASSFSAGPWLERWPQQQASEGEGAGGLPLAIEITMEIEGYNEVKRLFSLVKGE
ncbi:type II secretion system minor pseudopilin GspJ [Agarilytica rhodophyticola]|uniref:type II secretion system minor pseudopilin GspJ n=1 Tax=Agarilytica rhodophyticola TaxID=1737490 RepID=UPI001319D23E|nr:type II secretion system minor pseudopilin GspJ [Agarilytica rhodophyticola]